MYSKHFRFFMGERFRRASDFRQRYKSAEGGLWQVVFGLSSIILAGTFCGWYLVKKNTNYSTSEVNYSIDSVSPKEVYESQYLFNRLKVLQIDRIWFINFIDAIFSSKFPESPGRLPTSKELSLGRSWDQLSKQFLVKLEQLPPDYRSQLGEFNEKSWAKEKDLLLQKGLSELAIQKLVSFFSKQFLPDFTAFEKPPEPILQIWIANALFRLPSLKIQSIETSLLNKNLFSSLIQPMDLNVIEVLIPQDSIIRLDFRGTPFMKMIALNGKGKIFYKRGPLKELLLTSDLGNVLHILIENNGLSSGLLEITGSLL